MAVFLKVMHMILNQNQGGGPALQIKTRKNLHFKALHIHRQKIDFLQPCFFQNIIHRSGSHYDFVPPIFCPKACQRVILSSVHDGLATASGEAAAHSNTILPGRETRNRSAR